MRKEIFDDCYINWSKPSKDVDKKTWQEQAIKWGYGSDGAERIRSDFKFERKKLGILKSRNSNQDSDLNSYKEKPMVGVCDIETLPAEVYTFQLYDQNIGIEQVKHPTTLLSWAGKFLNDSDIYKDIMTPNEAKNRNPERIVKSAWDFLSKCDAVVGHNWTSFDGKIMNTMFLKYGLPPLKYVIIDTLVVAKSSFRFDSNKLAYINEVLGIRNKISNEGFSLWRKCVEGDSEALEKMMEYNIGDIFATEDTFYRIRPYVRNFNVGLYNELTENQCPVCGCDKLKEVGFYYTSAGKYVSVRCDRCGCMSRKKENLLSPKKRKSLLINS